MAQKGKTGPVGPASGPSITVDKVLATAMKMIEESGVDAFSMRKLAAELGVGKFRGDARAQPLGLGARRRRLVIDMRVIVLDRAGIAGWRGVSGIIWHRR